MNVLTIYSEKYDLKENVINDGMSNKAFLDTDNQIGAYFSCADEALDYVANNNIPIHRIDFNYVDRKGVQMFKKFEVAR